MAGLQMDTICYEESRLNSRWGGHGLELPVRVTTSLYFVGVKSGYRGNIRDRVTKTTWISWLWGLAW